MLEMFRVFKIYQSSISQAARLPNMWPSDSRSNWNLEMLFCEERRTRIKTSQSKDESQPTYDAESGNRTRATLLVGGKCSHHCAIPVSQFSDPFKAMFLKYIVLARQCAMVLIQASQ